MSKENQKNKINRDQRIAIRLTEKELNIIKKKAEKMSITSSEMIRRLAQYGVCYKIEFEAAEDILYELGRIGNNLNQITRGLNTNIIKGEEFELKDLKRNIDTIRNDLKILQETVNQYYKDNNIKKLEQIKIEE